VLIIPIIPIAINICITLNNQSGIQLANIDMPPSAVVLGPSNNEIAIIKSITTNEINPITNALPNFFGCLISFCTTVALKKPSNTNRIDGIAKNNPKYVFKLLNLCASSGTVLFVFHVFPPPVLWLIPIYIKPINAANINGKNLTIEVMIFCFSTSLIYLAVKAK
jgi:hypothetical protein